MSDTDLDDDERDQLNLLYGPNDGRRMGGAVEKARWLRQILHDAERAIMTCAEGTGEVDAHRDLVERLFAVATMAEPDKVRGHLLISFDIIAATAAQRPASERGRSHTEAAHAVVAMMHTYHPPIAELLERHWQPFCIALAGWIEAARRGNGGRGNKKWPATLALLRTLGLAATQKACEKELAFLRARKPPTAK